MSKPTPQSMPAGPSRDGQQDAHAPLYVGSDGETTVQDPRTLSKHEQLELIKSHAISRLNRTQKDAVTVTYREVIGLLRGTISDGTAYNRMKEVAETFPEFQFGVGGDQVLLLDP